MPTREDIEKAREEQLERNIGYAEKGVIFDDPYSAYIAEGTLIGEGTHILPGVVIEKDVEIGRNCSIGPYVHIRPGSRIADEVKLGNFTEIKNSVIGKGTKVSHLTYVGDADLGEGINLGCGVVFVNYDGKSKHRTSIADRSFIGCNTNLIAPVHVAEGAYIAAGTTVTRDVPEDSLCIAREKQQIIDGWAKRSGLIKEKGAK